MKLFWNLSYGHLFNVDVYVLREVYVIPRSKYKTCCLLGYNMFSVVEA